MIEFYLSYFAFKKEDDKTVCSSLEHICSILNKEMGKLMCNSLLHRVGKKMNAIYTVGYTGKEF